MDKTIVDVYNSKLDARGRMPRSALRHLPDWREVEPEDAPKPRRRRARASNPVPPPTPTDSDATDVEVPAEPVEQSDAPGSNQWVTSEES